MSKDDATRRAQIIKSERRTTGRNVSSLSSSSLTVYQCPNNQRLWHLTSVDPNEYNNNKQLKEQCPGLNRTDHDCLEDL